MHSIEGRSKIVIPVIGFHNDPGIYKDPERFNPDRMTKEKIKKRHPCSFMPFGIGGWLVNPIWMFINCSSTSKIGPRVCMAQRVGYLYVKLGLVVLLRRFRFSLNAKTEEPIKLGPWAPDMMPTSGVWLNVQRYSREEEEIVEEPEN